MKKFLIIEDDPSEADLIERRLKQCFECDVVKLIGATSTHILPNVIDVLSEATFDGTLLDIIYSGERTGGITLWSSLEPRVRKNGGKLVVVTKDAPQYELDSFVEEFAAGRKVDSYVEAKMTGLFRSYFGDITPPSDFVPREEYESLRRIVADLFERVEKIERRPWSAVDS